MPTKRRHLLITGSCLFAVATLAQAWPYNSYMCDEDYGCGGRGGLLEAIIAVPIFIWFVYIWAQAVIARTSTFWKFALVWGGFAYLMLEYSRNWFGSVMGWLLVAIIYYVWISRQQTRSAPKLTETDPEVERRGLSKTTASIKNKPREAPSIIYGQSLCDPNDHTDSYRRMCELQGKKTLGKISRKENAEFEQLVTAWREGEFRQFRSDSQPTSSPMTVAEWLEKRAKLYNSKHGIKSLLEAKLKEVRQEGREEIAAQLERVLEIIDQSTGIPDILEMARSDPRVAEPIPWC